MFGKLFDRVDYLYMLRACWRVGERRQMVVLMALSLLQVSAGLFLPYLQGRFVGAFVGSGNELVYNVTKWLILIMVVSIVAGLLYRQCWVMEGQYGAALEQNISSELFQKVVALPWRWHQAHHSADVTKRINDASGAISNVANNMVSLLDTIFRFAGGLIAITLLNPWFALLILAWLPLANIPVSKLNKSLGEVREQSIKASREVSTGLSDYIGNIGTILTLRLEESSLREHAKRILKAMGLSQLSAKIVGDRSLLIGSSQNVFSFVVTILFLFINRDKSADILVANVVALQGYLGRIDNSVHNFSWLQQFSMTSRAQLASADEIEKAYVELGEFKTPKIAPDWNTLTLSHLTFRYEDQEHHVHQLADVSLELHRGQRVALVGSSGSGKSTLLRLMRGLHDPASGTLALDGQAAEFTVLANLSTLVLQDAEIFENTLAYNITFGMEAEQAQLDRAIHAACLAPVLETLPQGLETDIRERGVNLSGGQKQRLALARGLYAGRASTLLLLDEPTSSLDTVTEAQIFDRLFADRPDACIVASLHRLHLLERFDHVYVMDQGRVVEQGTFSALMAANGKLAQLWQAQRQEETVS